MYIPKVKAARYENQIFTELNGERNSNVIITDNFNIPLLVTDHLEKKINKETANLNKTTDLMVHIHIHKYFLQKP